MKTRTGFVVLVCLGASRRLSCTNSFSATFDPQHPQRGYYESWLFSLERLPEGKQLLEESRGAPP
jgi:hypothetical protein